MKNENEGSHKQLPTELGSAEIFEFIYVDRPRVSVLYSQLFPQGGLLTSVKTNSQQTFSDDQNLGSDIKILKAETKSSEGGSQGIEHVFDPTWSIPLEVLSRLQSLSMIHASLKKANLGSIVLAEGFLRIIDYAGMKDMWEPALKMAMKNTPKGQKVQTLSVSEMLSMFKALPQSIHAQFLASEGLLWSSLRPADFLIPTDDLTLKYGGTVLGRWKILCILDAYPDDGKPPDVSAWSAGDLSNAVLTAMHGIRLIIGRPVGWAGVTPLMIFRAVNLPTEG
jgi:hypothetical protein